MKILWKYWVEKNNYNRWKEKAIDPKTLITRNQKQPKFTSQNTAHTAFQILPITLACHVLD